MAEKKYNFSFKLVLLSLFLLTIMLGVIAIVHFSRTRIGENDTPITSEKDSVIEYQNGLLVGTEKTNGVTGFGSFRNEKGESYTGYWDAGKPEGKGKYTYENGAEYSGDFKDGLRSGQGSILFADGTSYSGSWKDDSIEGEGILNYPDGLGLSGLFEDGLFKSGIVIIQTDYAKYELDFSDGEFNGSGKIEYSNGDNYTGELSLNTVWTFESSGTNSLASKNQMEIKKNGYGQYTWYGGRYYKGQWVDDKMSGSGELHFLGTTEWINGVFKDNKPIEVTYHSTTNSSLNNTDLSWDTVNGGK